jgi:biopolymer transport protein ExbD
MRATPRVTPSLAADLNITPMLDILLVLLIIFMAAVMQVRRSHDVQLPRPCAGACNDAPQIVLEVMPGPTYRVNSEVVAPHALLARLREIYRGRPSKVMQLAGDPSVTYQQVVTAMDIASQAGVLVIGAMPKKPPR